MTPPTTLQQAVLTYIAKCLEVEQHWPTARQIAEDFGWLSINAANEHTLRLERAGHITRNAHGKPMLARYQVVIVAPGATAS